jgi:hypothetical protein
MWQACQTVLSEMGWSTPRWRAVLGKRYPRGFFHRHQLRSSSSSFGESGTSRSRAPLPWRMRILSDVNLVVYCRSRNSFVSARVGVAMRKHGLHNVHVLTGGLKAWKGLGFPLTEQFADIEAEVARLGMEVSPPWKHIPPRKP